MAQLCCGSGLAKQRKSFTGDGGESGDILLLGMEGSGKTVLARALSGLHAKAPVPAPQADTVSTIGTDVYCMPCGRGAPFKHLYVREVGGAMVTLWPQYYGSGVHGVLFCIDLSDPVSLAAAGLELHQLLADQRMASRHVCVVLTKADAPATATAPEMDTALGLAELARTHVGRLDMVALSALAGRGECPELQAVFEWCITAKAAGLGMPAYRPRPATTTSGSRG